MPLDLRERYLALWQSSQAPPDPLAFLDQCGEVSAAQKLVVLLADQTRRWQTDQAWKVEDYLARFPALASDPEVKLQLAMGEFQAQLGNDTAPNLDEFTRRFADIGDTLRSKLAELASRDSGQGQREPSRTQILVCDSSIGDQRIGRYRVIRVLGEGAFGKVFLGFDEELQRQVAIKVPAAGRFQKPADAEAYLAEARTAANLDHPNVVPVHDVGRTDNGSIYVVSKFIDGETLADRVKASRFAHDEAAQLLATVAKALQHAHQKHLIHRDIKPGNILIENITGTPYVADFGLAIREEDYLKESKIAGTPAYMSPEQARGEGHRLDGRSDIFSLGVVLYELLTGKRPFRGSTANELLHQVVSVDPRQPRQLDDTIPAELERICLKALSKRASDRYASAAEFADDLLHWQQGPEQEHKELKIVPKGLRSFDAGDADFFLELLPGPRNRDGLPESIQFWKTRIEQTDPDKTFSVALIYGPSGCGKSSLVKAGLLPRLSNDVTAVYVEATAADTEARILRGLRKRLPGLPEAAGLVETFTLLRRSEGRKVVIVLDQFEQWLHAHRAEQETELVRALRQCDGGTLQAVLMVRDDFSMAAARFMRELEARIVEGHNFATVDLFDVDHAERVLILFGQAFGKLPAQTSKLTDAERAFVTAVASGLAQDGKVVSIRLALFAEMVKGKSWKPSTLQEVGGCEGIGVNFLDETFASREANPEHRLHQKAALRVLQALLPEVGTNIRGHMRSHVELLEASQYQHRPGEFNDLLRILDGELRLITPTDPEGMETGSGSDPGSKFYQLTHDYLVPSLREWLTKKQRESRRGRAELRLADRAALWNARPENQQLPSLREYANIRGLTARKNWTEPQRNMMRKASRYHSLRALVLILLLSFIGWGTFEFAGAARAEALVRALQTANTAEVPQIVDELRKHGRWADTRLRKMAAAPDDSKERLHAALALLPVDPGQVEYLRDRLLHASMDELPVVRDALASHKDELIEPLWRILLEPEEADVKQRLHVASALAAYDADSPRWNAASQDVAQSLVSVNPVFLGQWMEHLRPVGGPLIPALSDIFRDRSATRTDSERSLATSVLADFAGGRTEVLADLVMDAGPKQFSALFPELAKDRQRAIQLLDEELNRTLSPAWQAAPRDVSWPQADPTAVRQIEAFEGLVDEQFALCQTMPMDEFVTAVELLRTAGYRPVRLRPYTFGNDVKTSVLWLRDGRDWQTAYGVSAQEILERDEQWRAQGFMPVDVAGYLATATDDVQSECYAALWTEPLTEQADARMYVGTSDSDHDAVCDTLSEEGLAGQTSLQAFVGSDGAPRYSGIRSNHGGSSIAIRDRIPSEYEEEMQFDRTQWDVGVSLAGKPLSVEEHYAADLVKAEQQLQEDPNNLEARIRRQTANFYLGNDQQAIDDLALLMERSPKTALLSMRAILHARMGDPAQAAEDLEAWRQTGPPQSDRAYADAVVAVYLGPVDEGLKSLEAAVAKNLADGKMLYNAACVYSIAARVVKQDSAAKSQQYADRAVVLATQAVDGGYRDFSSMRTDPDLEPIRQHPAFVKLLSRGNVDTRYAAVWQSRDDRCSDEVHGLDPIEHLQRCRELASQGYRPASISVTEIAAGKPLVTTSVWHRAVVPESDKERLAQRQANAAVARLKLEPTERIWSLLKHTPDPRVRGWLIHRFGPLGADPGDLMDSLDREHDVAIRRALILSLGNFPEDSLDVNQRDALIEKLLDMYKRDPDPGIHGAAEWLLRRWGKGEAIEAIVNELSELPAPAMTSAPEGSPASEGTRLWFVNSQGQTMVVIPGPVEFAMGNPAGDQGRSADSWPRVRIGRTYAIGAKRLTVEQYQRFARATPELPHTYTRALAKSPAEMTQISVNWYEAAAYCRWLSEQEGVPDNQMCYPPIAEITEGMQLPQGYLQRTGYRLPSEAEWEYACRSGTVSGRHYGSAEELLLEYGWYKANSDLQVQFAGLLKPNDYGLFDMLGNVRDWCQESFNEDVLAPANRTREDTEDTSPLQAAVRRVIRGGAYWDSGGALTSTSRSKFWPPSSGGGVGFRIARTYK